ncbi:ABC transporter substrate-binding protein [Kiloniella sp. b19]|uniref:ABC transporter substrate-binding protein n=1 Tax=Kiloniella sp. GXU_MW_B19 TaxID=3141326 RepID=UPI0031D59F81
MPRLAVLFRLALFLPALALGWLSGAAAQEFVYPATVSSEAQKGPDQGANSLRIYSTTDKSIFEPVIRDFQTAHPFMTIHYFELQSLDLHERILAESDQNGITADLAISSAMDLQMKLVNDGYARSLDIRTPSDYPQWSRWRNEAFGITFEPVVTIYNKPFFAGQEFPANRTALTDYLNAAPAGLNGRVGTYDITQSGVGFLFMARDISQYSAIWELTQALQVNSLQTHVSSSDMIRQVASGELKLAYNVLGSYAVTFMDRYPDLGVSYPEDYTLIFSRIALVPKKAGSSVAGRLFLQYLLSAKGQELIMETTGFNLLDSRPSSEETINENSNNFQPIKVSPSLLVYQDQIKRRKILERWKRILHGPDQSSALPLSRGQVE